MRAFILPRDFGVETREGPFVFEALEVILNEEAVCRGVDILGLGSAGFVAASVDVVVSNGLGWASHD